MFSHLRKGLRNLFSDIRLSNCLVSFFASAFLAFGLYQVHAVSQVTEGGVLGMMLLLEHWTGLSPSISGLVMDAACYALGWRLLGRSFLVYSGISSLGFSAAYRVLECFPRLWPGLADMPLLASVLGAVFVGLGAGLCVRAGGATGGDDALAMSLSRLTRRPIERIYLASDLVVLALSASYIPLKRLGYSLLTVLLSGQLIGFIQRVPLPFLPAAGKAEPGAAKGDAADAEGLSLSAGELSPAEARSSTAAEMPFMAEAARIEEGMLAEEAEMMPLAADWPEEALTEELLEGAVCAEEALAEE